MVQLLLEAGASVNCRDCSERTSLIHAVQNEFEETETIIKLLFEHGATDLGSCEGENALSLSRLCMNQKIYTMLLQHDKENRTLQLETQADITVIFQDKSATMKFGSLHDDPELASDTLYQKIAQGDVETLQGLLERQIDRVASAGFHWLKDLVDSGMDMHEIAELLVDVESQTPWKHYEPEATCSPPCSPFFHRSSCIDCASARPKASCKIREISTPPEQRDIIKRKIVEQLGFAGIVPVSRESAEWDGRVEFEQHGGLTTAFVSYSTVSSDTSVDSLLPQLKRIGSRIRKARDLMHTHGVCCDYFTILQRPSDIRTDSTVVLRHIDLTVILPLLIFLEQAMPGRIAQLNRLQNATDSFLALALPGLMAPLNFDVPETEVMNRISLALQALSVGLMSYIRGHAGPIEPFFLDTVIHNIVFLASGHIHRRSAEPQISANLADLTCMSRLTGGSVLTFGSLDEHVQALPFDLAATPEDVIDTWGPARLVMGKDWTGPDKVLSIEIGDGILSRPPPQVGEDAALARVFIERRIHGCFGRQTHFFIARTTAYRARRCQRCLSIDTAWQPRNRRRCLQ